MINTNKPKTIIVSSLLLGSLLFVGGFMTWWRGVYSSPQRTFQRMLNNSLSTSSVSRSQLSSSEGVDTRQTTILQTFPEVIVKDSKSVTSETPKTNIVTDSVGRIDEEYTKYSSIQTDQKDEEGNPVDFKNAINVWSRTDNEELPEDGDLAMSGILGAIPVAQLSESDRSELIDLINKSNAYEVNYSSVKREIINGRPHYTYSVKLNLAAYVGVLKQFSANVGIKQLDNVEPSEYESSPPVDFLFGVDVWSGNLVSLESLQNSAIQRFGSYGIRTNITVPKDAITSTELQERLRPSN
ncbi:hypothetical protein KA068_01120 [Candidatus Saccharibacteria bacterium]|jgi:hypothetical protein|nr:hypothetical protein [Candidatus Saccharibacteria bacterium]